MAATMINPETGDVRRVPDALVEKYESRGFERQPEPDTSPSFLKGADLNDALDAAGLSKTGTADEKRARYAEHLAATAPE